MRQSATLAFQTDRLPKELAAAIEGGEEGEVYAVRIEKLSAEQKAIYFETRAMIQEGEAALESGDYLDDEEAFEEIEHLILNRAAK